MNSASVVIQVHTWAAIVALAVGLFVIVRPKGTVPHRWVGRFWLAVMLVTVISSFYIHELQTWGEWSPIHILSVITLVLLLRAYVAIRSRKVLLHADLMKSAFYNALILATFFTLMPSRIMHDVIFGPSSSAGAESPIPLWVWIIISVVVVVGGRHAVHWLAKRRALAARHHHKDPA